MALIYNSQPNITKPLVASQHQLKDSGHTHEETPPHYGRDWELSPWFSGFSESQILLGDEGSLILNWVKRNVGSLSDMGIFLVSDSTLERVKLTFGTAMVQKETQ